MRSKKKGKQKIAKEDHVAEALDKLREQTRETVKGLESLSSKQQPTGSDDAMVENWIKQFEDLPGSNILLMLADEVEVADELWNDVIDCMMLRVRDSEDALELMVGKFCGQCVHSSGSYSEGKRDLCRWISLIS